MRTRTILPVLSPGVSFFLCAAAAATGQGGDPAVYLDPHGPCVERVADLLSRLTLEEKVSLVSGKDGMATPEIERLRIPSLRMTDGPHGVRWEQASCFPTGISMASTWDPDLIRKVGVALAREAKARGRNMLLGPCINIHRVPLGGRNFESFSEDPYLASRMAVAYVQGVQSEGVIACPKHYAANNQEWARNTVSVEISERALREIYLPAFRAVVKEADAYSIMTAYNRVNGDHCTANRHLLAEILKGEWGFQGFTVSDWGALHETVRAANSGQDLEMPGPGAYFTGPLLQAVKDGEVPPEVLDDMVRRILRAMIRVGLLDADRPSDAGAIDTPEHRALARRVAGEATVLLKNDDDALPLDPASIRTLAVVGPNAAQARRGGGGSSAVDSFYLVGPLEGIRERYGSAVEVRHAAGAPMPGQYETVPTEALFTGPDPDAAYGLRAKYFANAEFKGDPVLERVDAEVAFDWGGGRPADDLEGDSFSAVWEGYIAAPADGAYELGTLSDDGSRLYVDGELLVDNWGHHPAEQRTETVELKAGERHSIRLEYFEAAGQAVMKLVWNPPGEGIREAAALAAKCDAAVVCVGLSEEIEGEGRDRHTMDLPGRQDALVRAIAVANPRTIVVIIGGTPVSTESWIDGVPAVLWAGYPGQEGGHAIAEVLAGDVNPSGKLPTTFPRRLEDSPAFGNYPGTPESVEYAEGIYVGYRHFDKAGVEPRFPFGHGLSYTKFSYANLAIDSEAMKVSLEIANVGPRHGAEVVQLYVRDVEADVDRPVKELKRFARVEIEPGKTTTVAFTLTHEDFAYYDESTAGWIAEPGEFEILVGASSRDIRLKGMLTLR